MTDAEQIAQIKKELKGNEYYGLANDTITWLLVLVESVTKERDELKWRLEGLEK